MEARKQGRAKRGAPGQRPGAGVAAPAHVGDPRLEEKVSALYAAREIVACSISASGREPWR